jgi:nitrate/TMAO reductase-like tetraheme cytochrome c subunit
VIGLVSAVLLVAAFLGVAAYTDRPEFCGSCHEMQPYVDAWASGPHGGTWCVDCHVGKSYPARLAHKFVALKEVVAHFSGDTRFPRATAAAVDTSHCASCHTTVAMSVKGFDHAKHASQGPCQACHADSGHRVTQAALTAVGAFKPGIVRIGFGTAFATVDAGSADLAGHVKISCTRCHDLKKTGCERCHTPTHKPRGECSQCHEPGATWVFVHPTKADCQTCHTPSAKHFKPATGTLSPCTRCHTQPGKSWAFAHPGAGADCSSCHALPKAHFKPASGDLAACSACHKAPGASWKFSHPGSGADCRSCHTPPAAHSAGQCSACHKKTGVSFAFAHPSVSTPHGISVGPCTACHPNGYSTHSCTCH